MGRSYFILVDKSLPALVAKMCSASDNSECVGWQQTQDQNTGRLRYEAVMVRETPEPPTERRLSPSEIIMQGGLIDPDDPRR